MVTHSIRWRLLLWLASLLVVILGGFGVTAYQLNRLSQLRQIDESLETRVAALTADVRGTAVLGNEPPGRGGPGDLGRPPPDRGPSGGPRPPPSRRGTPDGPPPELPRSLASGGGPLGGRISERTRALFDDGDPHAFYYATWTRGGVRRLMSANAPDDLSVPPQQRVTSQTQLRTRGPWREAYFVTERGDCQLAGVSILGFLDAMRRFAWWLVAAGAGVLAVGLGGAWFLAGRALRPIDAITTTASRIAAGDLTERIRVSERDGELGRLAGVLNSTFARLEAAFAQQKQFTVDAAHELRTPLAVIISETQTTLTRERSAADYRETISTCLQVAQEMRRLSESLLELSRFDAGQEPMRREPVDLAEIVRSGAERLRPLAAPRGIEIHLDLAAAPLQGDSGRLTQVVTNLLQNGVQHNRPGGEVRVRTLVENAQAVLIVADNGPGIAIADRPRVFERFYRADRNRAHAEGHSGLGLAITKAIVDVHGGSIELASELGAGATFTVRLPQ